MLATYVANVNCFKKKNNELCSKSWGLMATLLFGQKVEKSEMQCCNFHHIINFSEFLIIFLIFFLVSIVPECSNEKQNYKRYFIKALPI